MLERSALSSHSPEAHEDLQISHLWVGPAHLESLVDVSIVVHHLSFPGFALGALRDKGDLHPGPGPAGTSEQALYHHWLHRGCRAAGVATGGYKHSQRMPRGSRTKEKTPCENPGLDRPGGD